MSEKKEEEIDENYRQDVDNRIDSNSTSNTKNNIKSTAVVKYSAALAPARFTQLQCNTNLNLTPSNWLSDSVSAYGVQPSIIRQSGFSSFRMAHMLPDCVGAVDVISDAENIKKLLKIAYTRSGPISLMVHRVQNTLLIDEFDVKKILLASTGRWDWFKKFFDRVSKINKIIQYKDNSRTALQQRSLASKFLYHSLVIPADDDYPKTPDPNIAIPLPFRDNHGPLLPEAELDEELPDPGHKFSRNVVWTFEDIQMLLGTDMPIFGGGTHPCVSLRLRDMNKPINVLTGLDYWLDNLMCNVPEVVMCFHLNGIVQRYELIKTEDLPHLPNSRFSPNVVRDIAKNILSFLKSNATKAGHTYWLFKGHDDDDVVKLYDLTSLCTDVLEENGQTPFTVPVAMLLYRVARNMKSSSDGRRHQTSTIRMLLDNCVSIMPNEKYSEIITSAHFMLSDLYIPADLDAQNPNFTDIDDDNDGDDHFEPPSPSPVKTMSLKSVRQQPQQQATDERKKRRDSDVARNAPPPLPKDVLTRCSCAMRHVISGFERLAPPPEEPELANPNVPIPMDYQPLNEFSTNTTSKQCGSERKKNKRSVPKNLQLSASPPSSGIANNMQNPSMNVHAPDNWSWYLHLKQLLCNKARLIAITQMEAYLAQSTGANVGAALRHARIAHRIQSSMSSTIPSHSDDGMLYARFGDAFFLLVQHGPEYMAKQDSSYREENDDELKLAVLLKWNSNDALFPWTVNNLEMVLTASAECYKRAVALEPSEDKLSSIKRRFGNIENELGVYYMNQAIAKYQKLTTDDKLAEATIDIENQEKEISHLLDVSEGHLLSGVNAFEETRDGANLALLLSNTGRLMRVRAYTSASTSAQTQERRYYDAAINNYLRAIAILRDRSRNPPVWDSVYWELSTTYFTIASLLQDYPTGVKTHDEAEREVVDMLHKALKYCDLDTSGLKLPVYQFRAAQIHHRLASLHHSQLRNNEVEDGRKKYILQLCKSHYEKASKLFLQLEHPTQFLRLQMERVGLAENLAQDGTRPTVKQKHLQNALELIVESKPMLKLLTDDKEIVDEEENTKLVTLMQRQLLLILQALTKITSSKGSANLGDKFKEIYTVALRNNTKSTVASDVAKSIIFVIEEISRHSNLVNFTTN